MVSQKVNFSAFPSFRRKPESSEFNMFWMPVEDPVFSGDQARHDDFETFYEFIKFQVSNFKFQEHQLMTASFLSPTCSPIFIVQFPSKITPSPITTMGA